MEWAAAKWKTKPRLVRHAMRRDATRMPCARVAFEMSRIKAMLFTRAAGAADPCSLSERSLSRTGDLITAIRRGGYRSIDRSQFMDRGIGPLVRALSCGTSYKSRGLEPSPQLSLVSKSWPRSTHGCRDALGV